jgi:hypothetical protein
VSIYISNGTYFYNVYTYFNNSFTNLTHFGAVGDSISANFSGTGIVYTDDPMGQFEVSLSGTFNVIRR